MSWYRRWPFGLARLWRNEFSNPWFDGLPHNLVLQGYGGQWLGFDPHAGLDEFRARDELFPPIVMFLPFRQLFVPFGDWKLKERGSFLMLA